MASTYRFSTPYATFGVTVVALFVAAPLLAQPPGRGQGSPRYDLATEATERLVEVAAVKRTEGP
jgi:hypothetical protein